METKKVPDEKSKKAWIISGTKHFLSLIVFTLLLIALWEYMPTHEGFKRFTTIILFVLFYKPILAGIELIKGLMGLTNTKVLKEDKPKNT
ncbi:MAG TPA: hypothetical protein PK886_02450 [Candidatus Paceibacterota bacterium]|nr:hypothetical protein [Candidatus Paceibacterota bacterium]